jgi:hypothetical protein
MVQFTVFHVFDMAKDLETAYDAAFHVGEEAGPMTAHADLRAVLGSILTAGACLSMPSWAGAGALVADPVLAAIERHVRIRRRPQGSVAGERTASRNCRPPAWHYETANSDRQRRGVLLRIRSNPCLIAANLASM